MAPRRDSNKILQTKRLSFISCNTNKKKITSRYRSMATMKTLYLEPIFYQMLNVKFSIFLDI